MDKAFKKSDIEILVATMYRENLDFLIPMFPHRHFFGYNILIINQTSEEFILSSPYPKVRVVNVFDSGLSKSRNLALQNTTGKLGIIADDDVVFANDFDTHIVKAFNDVPDAAVISFRAESAPGQLYKKYPAVRKTNPGRLDRLNIMSIEMVLNLGIIEQANIRFNENFGLGATFAMGEETLFFNEVCRQCGVVVMEPKTIVMHPQQDSHTKVSLTEKYYIQGALFTALYPSFYFFWVLLKIAFDLKQHKIKPAEISKAITAARKGRNDYNQ